MLLQLARRFYETHFIQIFSKGAQMHSLFYLTTLSYYSLLVTGIIGTAPGFTNNANEVGNEVLNIRHFIGVLIFAFSWWNQFQSNLILVNLRKDSSGKTILLILLEILITFPSNYRESHHGQTLLTSRRIF